MNNDHNKTRHLSEEKFVKMWKSKFFLVFLSLANFSLALPTQQVQLKLFDIDNCSPELKDKVLTDSVKKECNLTLSNEAETKAQEKLCLAVHFEVVKLCQNGKTLGNANGPKEVRIFRFSPIF